MSALGHFMTFSIQFRDHLAGCFAKKTFPTRDDALKVLTELEGFADLISDELLLPRIAAVMKANRNMAETTVSRDHDAFRQAVKEQEDAFSRVMAYTMSPSEFIKPKRKKKRTRPETIKRNVEICDLRKADKKKWSMTLLGRKYGMKRQSIQRILDNNRQWRKLLSKLPSA